MEVVCPKDGEIGYGSAVVTRKWRKTDIIMSHDSGYEANQSWDTIYQKKIIERQGVNRIKHSEICLSIDYKYHVKIQENEKYLNKIVYFNNIT